MKLFIEAPEISDLPSLYLSGALRQKFPKSGFGKKVFWEAYLVVRFPPLIRLLLKDSNLILRN
jgi:hypothetical protein